MFCRKVEDQESRGLVRKVMDFNMGCSKNRVIFLRLYKVVEV